MERIDFDLPDYWRTKTKPKLQLVVRVTDPTNPSTKQIQEIQNRINSKLAKDFPGLRVQRQLQRINVSIVSGRDVPETIDLDHIFEEAKEVAENSVILPPAQSLEEVDNPLTDHSQWQPLSKKDRVNP